MVGEGMQGSALTKHTDAADGTGYLTQNLPPEASNCQMQHRPPEELVANKV